MNYFVGLDVSLKRTAICIVDRDGNIVREGVTDTEPEAHPLRSAARWAGSRSMFFLAADFRKADYQSFVLRPGTQRA